MANQRTERDTSAGTERGTSPDSWDGPVDEKQDGGDYPNYQAQRGRTGHGWIWSQSKDNEFISIQHRAGSKLVLKPDGALEIVSQRGRYDITFGEHRQRISGASDVTAKGDMSQKTDGARYDTTYKNHEVAVAGDKIESYQSVNSVIAENVDTVAGSVRTVATGGISMGAQGQVSIVGAGGATFGSASEGGSGDTTIGSSKHLAMAAAQEAAIQGGTKASLTTKAGNIGIDSGGGGRVYINSGQSTAAPTLPSNSDTGSDQKETSQEQYLS